MCVPSGSGVIWGFAVAVLHVSYSISSWRSGAGNRPAVLSHLEVSLGRSSLFALGLLGLRSRRPVRGWFGRVRLDGPCWDAS